ncbi:hypothetical protein KY348_01510 [Candidatus Woesearchaeota archaeon]|nr:hypothetical protein [Candidatus Woesearchaeota archaeon]
MIIRPVNPNDQDQLFECFQEAQVKADDIVHKPISGFYEYNLDYEALKQRAQTPFSLILENSKGKIISYMLAYPLKDLDKIKDFDPVHEAIKNLDEKAVYLDQVYLKKGFPIYFAMRLFDKWDHLNQNEKISMIIGAVPFAPWRNHTSERMVAYRGLRRFGFAEDEKVRLALFEKPYYNLKQ